MARPLGVLPLDPARGWVCHWAWKTWNSLEFENGVQISSTN